MTWLSLSVTCATTFCESLSGWDEVWICFNGSVVTDIPVTVLISHFAVDLCLWVVLQQPVQLIHFLLWLWWRSMCPCSSCWRQTAVCFCHFSNQRRVSDGQKWSEWEWKLSVWFYKQKQKTTDVMTPQVLTVCLAHAPRFFQQRHSNMNIGSCYPFIFLTLSCSDNREDYRLDVSSHMPSVSSPSPSPVLTAHIIRSSFSCRLVRYLRAWKYSSVDPRLLSAVIKSRNAAQFKLIKPFIKLNNLCFTWEEGNCTFSRAIL